MSDVGLIPSSRRGKRLFNKGDLVLSKRGTLAHFCGDIYGCVESFDGDTILVRMRLSDKLVPFHENQLESAER